MSDLINIEEFENEFFKEYHSWSRIRRETVEILKNIAAKIKKMQRDNNIVRATTASTGIVGGIMTVVGVILAAPTAGVSLGLTVAGIGLGVVSGVTGATSAVVKIVRDNLDNKDVKRALENDQIVSERLNTALKQYKEKCDLAAKCAEEEVSKYSNKFDDAKLLFSVLSSIGTTGIFVAGSAANLTKMGIAAGKAARIARNVQMISETESVVLGTLSLAGTGAAVGQAAKTIGPKILNMATKSGRIFAGVASGVFVVVDVVDLVLSSKDLANGTCTASESIMNTVKQLEEELESFEELYQLLDKDE